MTRVLLLAALAFPPPSRTMPPPVRWTVDHLPKASLRPGARFAFALHARIDPGWHIYALEEPEGGPLATEVGLAEGDPVHLLRVDEATPRLLPDPFFKQSTGVFQGGATFSLCLQLPPEPLPRDATLHIQVRYQSCNDRLCLPPHTDTIAVPLAPILH